MGLVHSKEPRLARACVPMMENLLPRLARSRRCHERSSAKSPAHKSWNKGLGLQLRLLNLLVWVYLVPSCSMIWTQSTSRSPLRILILSTVKGQVHEYGVYPHRAVCRTLELHAFETYAMQRALGDQLFLYAFPGVCGGLHSEKRGYSQTSCSHRGLAVLPVGHTSS
eukprot:2382890-Amphidinium_carterae.1